MLEKLNISMPVSLHGEIDISTQNEAVEKIIFIEEIKQKVFITLACLFRVRRGVCSGVDTVRWCGSGLHPRTRRTCAGKNIFPACRIRAWAGSSVFNYWRACWKD